MDDIRKFNRFELKYILSLEQVENLKKDLLKYVVPDKHWKSGSYILSSLYYDTTDYRFYWEKIEWLKFRRKLRVRRYVTDEPFTNDSMVYVEIKQRVDRVTQKRRVPMKYSEALDLIDNEILPKNYNLKDKVVLDEIINLVKTYNLKPSAITTYNRQAYFWTDNDIWLRVTFDTYVSYKQKDLNLGNAQPEWYMLPPNFSILEIKANEKIPYWVTELVASHAIKLIRVSKYCQALESAWIYTNSVHNLSNILPK